MNFETRRFKRDDFFSHNDVQFRKCLDRFFKNNKCVLGCREAEKPCCRCRCGHRNDNCGRFVNAPLTVYESGGNCGEREPGSCPCGDTSDFCFILPMTEFSPKGNVPPKDCNKNLCFIPPKIGYCYITPNGFIGIKENMNR